MQFGQLLLKLFVFTSALLDLSVFGKKLNTAGAYINSELSSMGLHQNTQEPKIKNRVKRAAMSNRARLWIREDGRPEIPYVIEKNNFADYTKQTIHMAMTHWAKHVPCLRFVQRTNQRSYISFFAGKGCYSDVGRMGGRQRVSIGHGCQLLATIIHEIGHALGFWHEQSRPDRDRYVRIYWRNIRPNYKYAFNKYNDGRINSLGVPYDYDSVMHYRSTAFGGGRTTITRINGDKRLGNRRGLSPYDIKQAKLLYCRSPRKPTYPPASCPHRDFSPMCRQWARRGHCSSSSYRYSKMSKHCKKTCFCRKRSVVCRDKKTSCSYWSRRGYCKSYTSIKYMRRNCRRSCGMCTYHHTRRT